MNLIVYILNQLMNINSKQKTYTILTYLFGNYEEAKEKYGDYNGMWWEIND